MACNTLGLGMPTVSAKLLHARCSNHLGERDFQWHAFLDCGRQELASKLRILNVFNKTFEPYYLLR